MIITTRGGAMYAISNLLVGENFRTVGATVTRDSRTLYRAANANGETMLIGPALMVVDRLFPPIGDPHASRLARLRAAVVAAELALDPPDGGPTIDVEAPDPLPPLPNMREEVL